MAWIPHCCGCGVGQAATALIRPLAWEPPYTTGVALKIQKKKKKKECLKEVRQTEKKRNNKRMKLEISGRGENKIN